jgi:AcrR family transcriptional regulator
LSRKTPEHKSAVRDRILAAARSTFSETGYRGTTIPKIAGQAGVSVGLIYRYFTSKEELFLEICLAGSSVAYDELRQQLSPITDKRARLRASFAAFLDAHTGERGLLVLQAVASAATQPRIAEALSRRWQELVAFSEWFVADAARRGDLDPDRPVRDLAEGVATMLDGSIIALAVRDAGDHGEILDSIEAVAARALWG